VEFLDHEWRRSWRLCKINFGASAKECRNKRLHKLNVCVAEFKDVCGLTICDMIVVYPINSAYGSADLFE